MRACLDATGSDATLRYVDDGWLAAQSVQPWTEIPLWAPAAPSLFRHAPAAAMRWRPLAETVADTWAWQTSLPGGWSPGPRTPGLEAAREAELLAGWTARAR